MKCGKLNLVDLAGSENISRSGARDVCSLLISFQFAISVLLHVAKLFCHAFDFCP